MVYLCETKKVPLAVQPFGFSLSSKWSGSETRKRNRRKRREWRIYKKRKKGKFKRPKRNMTKKRLSK